LLFVLHFQFSACIVFLDALFQTKWLKHLLKMIIYIKISCGRASVGVDWVPKSVTRCHMFNHYACSRIHTWLKIIVLRSKLGRLSKIIVLIICRICSLYQLHKIHNRRTLCYLDILYAWKHIKFYVCAVLFNPWMINIGCSNVLSHQN
jgi:hypothetical protein